MCREVLGSASGPEKTPRSRESVGLPDRRLKILGFSARTIWITGYPVEEIKNRKILKVKARAGLRNSLGIASKVELIIHNTCAVTGTISFVCCGSRLGLLRTELTVYFSKKTAALCDAIHAYPNQIK